MSTQSNIVAGHQIPYIDEGSVIFPTDTHWKDSDPPALKGYTEAGNRIFEDLMEVIIREKINTVVQTGDLADKGYRSDHAKYSDTNKVDLLNIVTGNRFAMCLGNHFFLEMDANPELYWIQPHHKYNPSKKIFTTVPKIKLPTTIRIGCVQISLFHHDKINKEYIAERQEGVKFHIGVYHDDDVLPASVKSEHYISRPVSEGYMSRVFANIDMAVMGHIHTPYPLQYLMIGTRKVPVYIPGSMCQRTTEENHKEVVIPIVQATPTTYSVRTTTINLHSELIRKVDVNVSKLPRKASIPENLQGTNNIKELVTTSTAAYMSCRAYLVQRGFSDEELALFDKALNSTVSSSDVVKTYGGI